MRGGCRGLGHPWDDLQLSKISSILPKKNKKTNKSKQNMRRSRSRSLPRVVPPLKKNPRSVPAFSLAKLNYSWWLTCLLVMDMLQVILILRLMHFQTRSVCFNLGQLVSTQVSLGQVQNIGPVFCTCPKLTWVETSWPRLKQTNLGWNKLTWVETNNWPGLKQIDVKVQSDLQQIFKFVCILLI